MSNDKIDKILDLVSDRMQLLHEEYSSNVTQDTDTDIEIELLIQIELLESIYSDIKIIKYETD